MYPRNAASPERILVGQVVLISDGTVQSTGVSITVRGQGGAEAAGGGTTAYSASDNSVYYTPTQAETNFTSFTVIAYKASCFSASVTVITTASVTPGYAGIDWAKVINPTTTVDLSATSINVVDQVTSIGAVASSGFNYPVSADNTAGAIIGSVTLVGTQTGTFANTETDLTTFHQITHSGNAIDLVYRIACEATNVAVSVALDAYLNSSNDTITIQLYDHVGAGWDTVETLQGTNGTNTTEITLTPFSKHTGTLGTSEAGNLYVRFVNTGQTAPVLFVARARAVAVARESTRGYEGGFVWCDEAAGSSSGTTQGVDGIFANQSDDLDNAITIADNLGSGLIQVANGNAITLTASLEGYSLYGNGSTLALGSQNIGSSIIREFGSITGVSSTSANPAFFEENLFGTASIPPAVSQHCGYGGTLTLASAGDYTFVDCYSTIAGSGSPTFTFSTAAITAEFRRWSGGIAFSGLTSDDAITVSGEIGTIDLGSPASAVTVEIRGTYKAISNIGSASVNTDGAIKGVDVASILVDTTTNIPALIAALNDLSAAQVNAEVVDALSTDTYAEPTQGTPGATIALADKINYLYKAWRNKSTQTATTYSLYNDDTATVDHKATVSDDGTTATKGETTTGP